MSGRTLYLVRHGRVDFGSGDFRQSARGRQWDPPLDDLGREQSERLVAALEALSRPSVLYSSPFRRCLETIEPFRARAGLEVAIAEDLGEVFVGEWEGMSFEEIVSSDEEIARRARELEPLLDLAPGGESGPALRARVVPAIEAIVGTHGDEDLIVVTHGGVINAYVTHVLEMEFQDLFFLPENTSMNTIAVEGDARRVRFLNDVRHINEPWVFGKGSRTEPPPRRPILRGHTDPGGQTLSVKFLSPEWAQALKDHLNGDEAFAKAIAGKTAKVQQVINTTEGETRYWLALDGGKVDMGVGDVDAADATVTQDYATAVALAKGELNPVSAFMAGKIKLTNLGFLMQLQGALVQLGESMRAIDTEY